MAKLFNFSGCTTCGVGGKTFEASADGSFDVPEDVVPALIEHGFSTSPTPPKPALDGPASMQAALAAVQADRDALAKRLDALEQALSAKGKGK